MWELKGYWRVQKRRQLLLQPQGGSSTENRNFSPALWAIGGNTFSKKMRPSTLIAFSLLYCSYSQHTIGIRSLKLKFIEKNFSKATMTKTMFGKFL